MLHKGIDFTMIFITIFWNFFDYIVFYYSTIFNLMLCSSSPVESLRIKSGMSCLPCILRVNWLMLESIAISNDLGDDGPPGYTLCSIRTSAPDSVDCE